MNQMKKETSLPYLDDNGNLVIPFNSDKKYHWWNGGQSTKETVNELLGVAKRPVDTV